MKKLLFIFTFIITTTAIAQSSNTIELEKKKMKQALVYGDESIAIGSMYNIIAIEGPQSTYKDSLAYLYFNSRKFLSCYLVANDILKSNPNNVDMLEMGAISLETVGAKDKAIESYKNLLLKKSSNYYAYKIAELQSDLNKMEEAYVSVKKASQLPDDGTMKITFKVNNNYNQSVGLKAAIAYLEGVISERLTKKEEAIASYEKAIQLFPEFVLAKSKLSSLKTAQ